MNIETRREPEPCTTRLTRDLADHFEKLMMFGLENFRELESEEFENLEKLEGKKAAGMRFVEDFNDRKCSPNPGLQTVDQAEQLEAQPPLPGL